MDQQRHTTAWKAIVWWLHGIKSHDTCHLWSCRFEFWDAHWDTYNENEVNTRDVLEPHDAHLECAKSNLLKDFALVIVLNSLKNRWVGGKLQFVLIASGNTKELADVKRLKQIQQK